MPEKKTKEQLRGEIESIFDQLISNTSSQPEDTVSSNRDDISGDKDVEDLNETQAQRLVHEGRGEIAKKRFAQSLKFFNQALELDPQCWDAWSAMGDALMEMGKIDQASICYKKAMASTFQLEDDLEYNKNSDKESKENDWQNYLMSFFKTKKDEPKKTIHKVDVPQPKPQQDNPDSGGLEGDLEDLFRTKTIKNDHIRKEDVHFPCPSCGSDVLLESGACSQCQTTFREERFENLEPMDDDLVFFSRLQALLGKEERFFIHFSGEDGSIRFLDKKDTSRTKKPSYVFVRANIEELGFDYSIGSTRSSESEDIDTESEDD